MNKNKTLLSEKSERNDALSRPTTRNSDAFGYNERGEIVSAQIGTNHFTHVYDFIGNQTNFVANAATNSYTHNNLNQISTATFPQLYTLNSQLSILHDLDGNLTNDCLFTYSYDAANRLSTVSSNGIVLVANEYDYRGRRTRKTTPTTETTFVYDNWNLVHETVSSINGNTTNTTEIQYLWGVDMSNTLQGAGGVGGLLALSVNGDFYFPAYDNNGNITQYIDENGNIVAAYEYDAFGRIGAQSGSLADFFRIRFSTKYFDSETGLYYYGYRFYSPTLMRWLNRDPIEELGGLNLYGFCDNTPLCFYDPHGDQAVFEIKITPRRVGIILNSKNHKSSYPRAATFHNGDLKFSCGKDCRIKVSGKLSLNIEMLERNNPRWDKSFPQYKNSPLVSEDLNAYNHELDHFYTWKAFYSFLKTANLYEGRQYRDCKAKIFDLQSRYSRFKSLTQRHSSTFDQVGRNMGGQYSRHPLDTSKFKWE